MSNPVPKYVVDVHGLKETFESSTNSIISGLAENEIHIFRQSGNDLRDAYPDLYQRLQNLSGNRRYVHLTAAYEAAAGLLIGKFGSSILGSKPPIEVFYHLVMAQGMGFTIISSGKAYKDYHKVIAKCGLPKDIVVKAKDY